MNKRIRNIIIYTLFIIIAGALVYLASNFGCAYVSENSSMTADINPGDNVTFTQMDFTADVVGKLEYSSVLIYKAPKKLNEYYVSRLIGKPGDLIECINGQLFRNRKLVDEKYITDKGNSNFPELLIPKNHVYLLCDDRSEKAADSRLFGPVNINNLTGIIQ